MAMTRTPKHELWVRNIESGRQIQIDTSTDAAADTAVTVVEFGPQLADCDLHTITWVTTDAAGRPCTAHVATVDPTTTTLTCSESQIMYHSEDPTVHVDVQRSKGCQYLGVHARTQTKNGHYHICLVALLWTVLGAVIPVQICPERMSSAGTSSTFLNIQYYY